jgi:diketogulonate reductase-like aldo/keto reductase
MWNQYSVGVPREQIFVTTKFWCQAGHGRSAAVDRLKESLALLMLTYVDLYLVHSPGSAGAGRAQSWAGMEDCVKQGLARSIGVSNYGVEHLKAYQPSRLIFYPDSLLLLHIHFSMSCPLRRCRRTPPSRLP